MNDTMLWWYYFIGLPLFALGRRPARLLDADLATGERSYCVEGVDYLRARLGQRFCPLSTAEIVRRAHLVKLVRESDTYTLVRINRHNWLRYFVVEGLEHIHQAHARGQAVVLLGGHLGSNYTMWVALGYLGHTVYTVARAVDRSLATPRSRQAYMDITYRITSHKWSGRYLMADSSGHFPRGYLARELERIFEHRGICFLAIDFPPTLYSGETGVVVFLGRPSRLPIQFIRWCTQRNVALLTVQDCVEFRDRGIVRRITLGSPLEGARAENRLQDYADRLTGLICREPWQWMGLPIAQQYHS